MPWINQGISGMPGTPVKGDNMGVAMTSGDSNGDGHADLVIHSGGDGLVTVAKGAAAGLSTSTAAARTQNTAGIPGTTEANDAWGGSLRFESLKAPRRRSRSVRTGRTTGPER